MNRLQFLRGHYSAETPVRPPWSLQEDLFVDVCSRCDQCIRCCHAHVIRRGPAGFPEMDFSDAGCDFCAACAGACETGAIQHDDHPLDSAWQLVASIGSRCFSERGVVCRSCGEVCETRAIRFRPALGGVTHLQILDHLCNGCGECVSICPAQAIQVKHVQPEQMLEAQS